MEIDTMGKYSIIHIKANRKTGKESSKGKFAWCFLLSCFFSIFFFSSVSQAKAWIGEKPMAGLTVTLEQYYVKTRKQNDEKKQAKQSKIQNKKQSGDEEQMKQGTQEPAYDDKLGVSVCSDLNVRAEPSDTARIIGKMPLYAGCRIIASSGNFSMITSGNVKGWVATDGLSTGKEGNELAKKIGGKGIRVTTQTLNVRELPSIDAKACDCISEEEIYHVAKKELSWEWLTDFASKNGLSGKLSKLKQKALQADLSNWMAVSVDEETVFVNKDFIKMDYTLKQAYNYSDYFNPGDASADEGSDGSGTNSSNSSDSKETGSLRDRMVKFAMQYLGNRYVWGGTSLTNGTDCSGFTMRIYEHFGIHIPRTSYQQAAAFRSISKSQLKKGDLLFYGSNGSVSHVAMYIGNNKVIHASNHRDGIKISYAFYRTPIKIGRKIG